MPNGNNLTGGTRSRWGLPIEQLPSTITPESMLEEQIQTGRRQIQDRFNLQWQEINRSSRFIGQQKALNMRQQLHAKAKQEMLQFNQQAQQQLEQLQNIDRLAQQGAIPNPDEIKARMTFGTDVARSMYPTPEKEKPPMQQFADLDTYSHRISQELEDFQIIGGKKPSIIAGLSPLTATRREISGIADSVIPPSIRTKLASRRTRPALTKKASGLSGVRNVPRNISRTASKSSTSCFSFLANFRRSFESFSFFAASLRSA